MGNMLKQWCCHEHFTIVSAHFFFLLKCFPPPIFCKGMSAVYIIAVPEMWKLDLLDKKNHCQCYNFVFLSCHKLLVVNFGVVSSTYLQHLAGSAFSLRLSCHISPIIFAKTLFTWAYYGVALIIAKLQDQIPAMAAAFRCGLSTKTSM